MNRAATSAPRLRVVGVERQARSARPMGVVEQVRTALRPRNRLATLLGTLLGGAVPIASWQLSHAEIDPSRAPYLQLAAWLVAGGLLFSALTVYGWARQGFGSGCKALGFCVLFEGTMVASHTWWLSLGALAYLVAVNAVATGVRLSLGGGK